MSTSTATADPTGKILAAIERRTIAREQAEDPEGLRALYAAVIIGRETVSEAFERITGETLADATSPTADRARDLETAETAAAEASEQERDELARRRELSEQAYRDAAEERDRLREQVNAMRQQATVTRDPDEQTEQIEQLVQELAQKHRELSAAEADKSTYHARAEKLAKQVSTKTNIIAEHEAEVSDLRRRLKSAELAALEAENPKPEDQAPKASPAEQAAEQARAGYVSRETSDLFAYIMNQGGIRPSTEDLREEYAENIPPSYRRRAPDGVPGDELAELLSTDRPELGITDEAELLDFFASRRRQARHARAATLA